MTNEESLILFEKHCEECKTSAKRANAEVVCSVCKVKNAKEAIKKQIRNKPDYEGYGFDEKGIIYDTWICPCCNKRYELDYEEYDHCPKCGQAIDWSNDR